MGFLYFTGAVLILFILVNHFAVYAAKLPLIGRFFSVDPTRGQISQKDATRIIVDSRSIDYVVHNGTPYRLFADGRVAAQKSRGSAFEPIEPKELPEEVLDRFLESIRNQEESY